MADSRDQEMSLVDVVAEAIYDATDQWGSLWAKTEVDKETYQNRARAALKIISHRFWQSGNSSLEVAADEIDRELNDRTS